MQQFTCSKCEIPINNFLWLNCSHHICLSCAKKESKESVTSKGQFQCSNCKQATNLNRQTLKFLGFDTTQDKKTKKKIKTKKEETGQNSYFCLNCMETLSEELKQYHKGHRVTPSSICFLEAEHLLNQQQRRLAAYNLSLGNHIKYVLSDQNRIENEKRLLEQQLKSTFSMVRQNIDKMQRDMLNKISQIFLFNQKSQEDVGSIEKLTKQKNDVELMLKQIKLVSAQKIISSLANYFLILDKTRKVEIIKFPQQRLSTPNVKLYIDEDSITKHLNSVSECISIRSKKSFVYENRQRERQSKWASRCYDTSLKTQSGFQDKSSDYFQSLKKKVFGNSVQKLMSEQRLQSFGRSYLCEISCNNRSNRFDSSMCTYTNSHNYSVKQEIQKLSKQIRQKSMSRKQGQKQKQNKSKTTIITL